MNPEDVVKAALAKSPTNVNDAVKDILDTRVSELLSKYKEEVGPAIVAGVQDSDIDDEYPDLEPDDEEDDEVEADDEDAESDE